MKNSIQNITIESLFEKDSELEYWQLRERASLAGIQGSDLFQLLKTAHTEGVVEMLPNNVIKFLGEVKPVEKRYKSTLTEGVKTANNLCAAVKLDMQMLFENVAASTDTIEIWEKRLNDSIAYNAGIFPKCGKPHVTRWHNHKDTQFINVYVSERAYINSAAFITISVQILNNDAQ